VCWTCVRKCICEGVAGREFASRTLLPGMVGAQSISSGRSLRQPAYSILKPKACCLPFQPEELHVCQSCCMQVCRKIGERQKEEEKFATWTTLRLVHRVNLLAEDRDNTYVRHVTSTSFLRLTCVPVLYASEIAEIEIVEREFAGRTTPRLVHQDTSFDMSSRQQANSLPRISTRFVASTQVRRLTCVPVLRAECIGRKEVPGM